MGEARGKPIGSLLHVAGDSCHARNCNRFVARAV